MAKKKEDKKNALTKAASNLPSVDVKAAAALLKQSADDSSTGGGDFDFLSFSGKMGTYSLGREKSVPEQDAIYILEPMAAVEGWNCWKGGKPVAKHEWSLYERGIKSVMADDLEDHGPYNEKAGEGWQQMLGIGMFDVDNPKRQIRFTTSSVSGRNVMSDLNRMIADDMLDEGDGIAVFTLGMTPFEAHGQANFKPVITVEGIVTRAEVETFLEEDEYGVDDLLEGRCAPKDNDVAAEEEAPVEEEAPKRRRRKAAK